MFIYFIIYAGCQDKSITRFIAWDNDDGEYEKKLKSLETLNCKILDIQKINTKKFGPSRSQSAIFMQIFAKMLKVKIDPIGSKTRFFHSSKGASPSAWASAAF